MAEYAEKAILAAKEQIGDGKVLLALSGGVDSSVVAALLERAVGSQLTCIFVDTGLMRKNEGDEVTAAFSSKGLKLIRVDAEARFLEKLKDVADPEQKRKIIGEEFIRVFEEEAKKLGKVEFLAQGTIYPDIVESNQGGKVVKSHHNVGGLPEKIDFKELVEPLKELYKPEVRELGRVLGLPDYLVDRQPFPGPGLGVRVIGALTQEKLDLLREADAIFREEIASAGLAKELSQYFAVLTGMRSVGVRGGERTYDYTLALRAIKTPDFMTAEWAKLPWELLEKVSARITGEIAGINRIVYDITSKPPSTIEWE
jgi:GMP synthase (glutamine-hydrolysing)